jgi:hypothetical protein
MKADANYDLYKSFIDDFVGLNYSVCAAWVDENRRWPDCPENEETNRFLNNLSDDDKKVLARLLREEAKSAIHNAVVWVNDEVWNGMIISRDGATMQKEPLGYQMYYDWNLRVEGKTWPEVEMMTIGEQISES